jgi:hypothetical protein
MTSSIYYLPGQGGHLETGLGEGLLNRGYNVSGRETIGEFRAFSFTEQVAIIADDLISAYWHEEARIIANSFGAYLFLHAQVLMKPFPGKVLLLSPIMGEFLTEDSKIGFIPPHAGKLLALAASGSYPTPKQCQIHVGALDWQSVPDVVVEFGKYLGLDVTVVPNAGHMLGKNYVGDVLDRWLQPSRER